QVILPAYDLLNIYNDEDEIKEAIDNGLKVRLGNYSINFMELEVVGITSFDDPIFNFNTYNKIHNELLRGYCFIITNLNQGDNSEFVKYCETEHDGVYFNVINNATAILDSFGSTVKSVTQYVLYVAIGFAVFAAVFMMNYFSTSISYKKREIGILRALGARGKDVFGIFFNEGLIIAGINFIISSILTIVLCFVINNATVSGLGVSIVLLNAGIKQILLILAISVFSAFISSLIPVNKISRKKPIDAINNR
ncbi:MAG: FtsX-like permease family protein, partial [bacterium]|nr:FtsX-like permease family protein [bacterium]